jgi:hypothetical protein
MQEMKKYFLRFGIALLIALPFLLIAGREALRIFLYKITMCAIGVALAELIWAAFFKPVYGATENLDAVERLSVLVFRGILYAGILIGLMLGL